MTALTKYNQMAHAERQKLVGKIVDFMVYNDVFLHAIICLVDAAENIGLRQSVILPNTEVPEENLNDIIGRAPLS